MTEGRFQESWKEILAECELEYLPKKRLQTLATRTTEQDLRFLLSEAERFGQEWAAVREKGDSDAGRNYWRKSTCVEEIFKLRGPEAANFLKAVAQDAGSPYQKTAARLLQSAAAHFDYEQRKAMRGTTTEREPASRRDFWDREK